MTIVIAGGGLSGSMLAAHLAAEPRCAGPVVMVDDRHNPLATAEWASWTTRRGLLDTAVSRRFDRVRVHAGGVHRTLGLGRYRYQVVRGADHASAVAALTGTRPGFSVHKGHVDEVTGDGVVVDGTLMPAEWVFDSVPRRTEAADAWLVFRGWRLHTDRPAFDPAVPTFFDFRTSQRQAASFLYVLPESPHDALVEHTAFAAEETARPEAQRAALAEYLAEVIGTEYTVRREESASLPLVAKAPSRRRGRALTIGAKAGMVKASTGYAYQRIQRDSAAIARSLAEHGHPFAIPEPRPRHRLFDGALLDVITHDPPQLERAFAALFDRASAEPVLKFLDEDTSIGQEARLFAKLPASVYLGAVSRRRKLSD
ncbi:lycopene cyclase family protein [Amycolatopsis sp. NPDC059657]|uniref:lycopene cyclase family protein n=1 Tax=Amycolatopsis sp. NPDC059657 TaxID=3346899 RepID=UPI00366F01C2